MPRRSRSFPSFMRRPLRMPEASASGDSEAWRDATRGVEPLRDTAWIMPYHEPLPRPPANEAQPASPPSAPFMQKGKPKLDPRNRDRLAGGHWPIDARIDLHGLTQQQAFERVFHFIEESWHLRRRCLLIITGLGRAEEPDRLKTQLPRWLKHPLLEEKLLATQPAQPRHGGEGALYVLLCRQQVSGKDR